MTESPAAGTTREIACCPSCASTRIHKVRRTRNNPFECNYKCEKCDFVFNHPTTKNKRVTDRSYRTPSLQKILNEKNHSALNGFEGKW
jgi:hypothetical protein